MLFSILVAVYYIQDNFLSMANTPTGCGSDWPTNQLLFITSIEKCEHLFPAVGFLTSVAIPPPRAAVQKRQILPRPPGHISQFHPPGIIMRFRVYKH